MELLGGTQLKVEKYLYLSIYYRLIFRIMGSLKSVEMKAKMGNQVCVREELNYKYIENT